MFVSLLILFPSLTFAGLLCGSAWHLSRAYRRQYADDCFTPVFIAPVMRVQRIPAKTEAGVVVSRTHLPAIRQAA